METLSIVGKSVLKNDGMKKVTGEAIFGNDIEREGMLYGKVLRSEVPHALIKNVETTQAMKLPGVVSVLTCKDIPGENSVGIIIKDEPVLVDSKIRRVGDAIALIAAETREIAENAAGLIDVEFEKLPTVSDVMEAVKESSIKVHGDTNILASRSLLKGDADKGFKKCALVVEKEYKTNYVAHMFIETEVTVAQYTDGVLTFWCSTQNAHYDRGEVSRVLDLPKNKVRGIQAETGGGFGGKLDISTQCHAALLAYHTKRPVKIVNSREESMNISSKRHPFLMRYKTGATKEGKLLAMEAELILDTGAYDSYGHAVLTRSLVHCTGPYEIPNVKAKGTLVYTNNPMAGAMRGFGVPQVAVAFEGQIDILARKLAIDPWEIRIKNVYRKGSCTGTMQKLESSVGMLKTIEAARKKSEEIMSHGRRC